MLEFVKQQKRDYAPSIVPEMSALSYSITVVFFRKSNLKNEPARLRSSCSRLME